MFGVYFGCVERVGHYYWRTGLRRCKYEESRTITPWGYSVDGKLTPITSRKQGAALLHYKDGWTALAIHDYTVDSRPGSNSIFCFEAILDFDEAIIQAKQFFPEIVERIGTITDFTNHG